MIVVKIELWSAVTGEKTEIGQMVLANDGTSRDIKRGNYDVKLGRRGVTDTKIIWQKPQKQARVELFPRQSFSVWVLVARALKNLGIERFADFYDRELDRKLEEEGL